MSKKGTLVQQGPGLFAPQMHMSSPTPIAKHAPKLIKITRKRKYGTRTSTQENDNKIKKKKLDNLTKENPIKIDSDSSSSDEENTENIFAPLFSDKNNFNHIFNISTTTLHVPPPPQDSLLNTFTTSNPTFNNSAFSNPPFNTSPVITLPNTTPTNISCNNTSSSYNTLPFFTQNMLAVSTAAIDPTPPPAPTLVVPDPPRFKSISPSKIPISVDIGCWFWWDEIDYKEFSQDLSLAIESAFKSGKNDYTFAIDQQKSTYTIYFDIMVQQNNQTSFRRQVQRKITSSASSVIEIPLNRFNVDYTFNFQYPSEWDVQDDICELVELSPSAEEFSRIDNLVFASLDRNEIHIASIHRIQNQHLWRRYFFERSHVQQKNGGFFNEIEAFHGTRTTNPVEIFHGEEGFDMRYSNQGRWGNGIYFASKASYSLNFAYAGTGGRQILLSRVALGSSFSCLDGDSSLRTPPAKRKTEGTRTSRIPFATDFHDSVVGVSGHTQIYTVYSNSKAYPSYLITFSN